MVGCDVHPLLDERDGEDVFVTVTVLDIQRALFDVEGRPPGPQPDDAVESTVDTTAQRVEMPAELLVDYPPPSPRDPREKIVQAGVVECVRERRQRRLLEPG